MPRTVQEILAHADELAKRFEDFEAPPGDVRDATALRDVRRAFEDAARAQERLGDAVSVARAEGHSWAAIGAILGTSGEAARQRYGRSGGGTDQAVADAFSGTGAASKRLAAKNAAASAQTKETARSRSGRH